MLSDGSYYEGCGQILFNNTVPSGAKLRELIGYGTCRCAKALFWSLLLSNSAPLLNIAL